MILTIEQYEQLLEDLHDLAIVAEQRSEQPISLATMKALRFSEWGDYRGQPFGRSHP